MQVLKETIRQNILETARHVFLEKGFQKASMKNIAEGAGITAPTIYCYFRNKDELFRELVKPVTTYFEDKKREVEDFDVSQSGRKWGFEARRSQYTGHVNFILEHREEFNLLFSCAGGSSLEHYFDSLVQEYESLMRSMIPDIAEMLPGTVEISDFFIHNMAAFYVNSIREAALHPVSREELEKFATEWALFRTGGWMALTRDGNNEHPHRTEKGKEGSNNDMHKK